VLAAHHVANRMVPRWYAEFCALADVLAECAILIAPCPCRVRARRCLIRPEACRLPSSRQTDFSFGVAPSASCEDLYPLNLPFGRFPPPVAPVQR
jgi:hypothetical protein